MPCANVELALEGAQKRQNAAVALLLKNNTSKSTGLSGMDTERDPVGVHSSNSTCPPWFVHSDDVNNSSTCTCGNTLGGVVKCNSSLQESFILIFYCVTHDKHLGTVTGICIYNQWYIADTMHSSINYRLPQSISELNNAMCGRLNRTGRLCGQCRDGFSPPVYSYDLWCVECSHTHYNWLKYILAAFLPLTMFFIIILSFRVTATSPQLSAFVLVSQIVAAPANARFILLTLQDLPEFSVIARITLAMYGIWNLDFFRTLIPHICLEVNTLKALVLDYAIGFLPLILLVVTYFLLELHAYKLRPIVWMWRPFHRCFARFQGQWDVKASIINAFATFLLLSYLKILWVSFDLLVPTQVFDINGENLVFYLFYDAEIEYFGKKHLPYAILALIITLIFNILPLLLLLLYPLQCFQRCLSICRLRWHGLHIFIDAFHGCYKNGTVAGTRDCRYFAAVYLIARIALLIAYAATLTGLFYAVGLLILIALAITVAIIQPYRQDLAVYNTVDTVLILTMAAWYGSILCSMMANRTVEIHFMVSLVVSFIIAILPFVYLSYIVL